eukprot:SAG31_NODE_1799_length_7241_cov_11.407029_7_plen_115_part_00
MISLYRSLWTYHNEFPAIQICSGGVAYISTHRLYTLGERNPTPQGSAWHAVASVLLVVTQQHQLYPYGGALESGEMFGSWRICRKNAVPHRISLIRKEKKIDMSAGTLAHGPIY